MPENAPSEDRRDDKNSVQREILAPAPTDEGRGGSCPWCHFWILFIGEDLKELAKIELSNTFDAISKQLVIPFDIL